MLKLLQVGGLDWQGIAQQRCRVGHGVALGQGSPGGGGSEQHNQHQAGYASKPARPR